MTDSELIERLERIEKAVGTMAWWLVDAQTGFGEQDAKGIEKILAGESTSPKFREDEKWPGQE